MLVKFNHKFLSIGTSTPPFVHETDGLGNPVALQYKDRSAPSLRVRLPLTRCADICTGTEKNAKKIFTSFVAIGINKSVARVRQLYS